MLGSGVALVTCGSCLRQSSSSAEGCWSLSQKQLYKNLRLSALPGLCALSINHSNSYLAYPGSQSTGEIVLYDGNSLVSSQRSLVYQPARPGQLVNRLDKEALLQWGELYGGALWPQQLGEGK